jgi:hypothetical protein
MAQLKKELTLADIDGMSAVELPPRETLAVAIAGGSLAAIAANVNVGPVIVDVNVGTLCVNVAAINSQAGC